MRALVLISSLQTGGAERVTVSLVRRLCAGGADVRLCTVSARYDGPLAAEVRDDGIRRYDLAVDRLADVRAVPRLLQLLRDHRIDVIHAHGQDASIVAALARSWRRTPLAITRHVLEEPSSNWRQAVRARGALRSFRRADAVVAVSVAAADWLARLARIPRTSIRVIPNGIDLGEFAGRDRRAARAALDRELGLDEAAKLVLMPAVLRDGKGHESILAAMSRLQSEVPPIQVLLAGAGEKAAVLHELARPFSDRVHFLGDRTDVPDLMAACDLVVLPSLAEALPTVLIEAAAAGRPVVATSVGGVPEIVDHGRTGWLVPPADPPALGDAVARLLLDPALAECMGRAAAEKARDRFSVDRLAESTLSLWHELQAEAA